jgi:hypothetical protein
VSDDNSRDCPTSLSLAKSGVIDKSKKIEKNRWWFLNFSTASLIFNKYKHEYDT